MVCGLEVPYPRAGLVDPHTEPQGSQRHQARVVTALNARSAGEEVR